MDRGEIRCPRQIVFLHRHETVIASGSPEIIRRPNQGHAWIIQISPLDVGDRGRAGEPVHVVGERGRQFELPPRRRVRLARADTRRGTSDCASTTIPACTAQTAISEKTVKSDFIMSPLLCPKTCTYYLIFRHENHCIRRLKKCIIRPTQRKAYTMFGMVPSMTKRRSRR